VSDIIYKSDRHVKNTIFDKHYITEFIINHWMNMKYEWIAFSREVLHGLGWTIFVGVWWRIK
jgi:hypothetical protein